MSSPPPTKPPRGVKQGKETSGLLMSVIRTLSASETNEQREKERAKLEKEYKKSDARLDELVAEHAQEITDVMAKFTLVGEALSTWGVHCEAAVGRLSACRGLLKLRRADLRRLWSDARTHLHALNMLTDIERVVVSERETRDALSSGRVLAAARTLHAALHLADTTLSHVTALNTTRQHLELKKRELVDVIVKRLSDAVYRSERAPLTRRLSARRRTTLLLAELTKSGEVTDEYLQDITPEFEASLTEEDSTFETTVMISLEALGVLDQHKEATEKFKVQIQNELLEVIDSVSHRIIEEGDIDLEPEGEEDGMTSEGAGVSETGRPLARLVACLGEELRAAGTRNRRLIQLWRAAALRRRCEGGVHTERHYWSAAQQVLQLLLTEYLEIESVNLAAARSSSGAAGVGAGAGAGAGAALRLPDYFAKKRPPRRTTKLFKLPGPAPGAAAAAGGWSGARLHRYPLVCRAQPDHLHAILPALHQLCGDIEACIGGGECSLRAFITNYVRAGESERLANAARQEIEACMKPDAWRQRVSRAAHNKTSPQVIFACCGSGWDAVERAARAAKRCGACGGQEALRATQAALATLATQCRAAHSRLVPAHGQWRAAKWLSDDDIERFLQSLPNWRAVSAAHSDTKPTAQELSQAYEREAEIIGSSLGDGAVSDREIMSDVTTLADIALMAESMDWLSSNIKSLPSLVSGGGGLRASEQFVHDTRAAAAIFDEIQHKCLLLLHLELRIQCFHYLGQEEAEGSDDSESAGGASQLARALLQFHEQASALGRQRLAYILGGIGEMMSAGVVWRCVSGPRRSLPARRLAALRHCLAALGLPPAGLHRAHHYLHLLDTAPQVSHTPPRMMSAGVVWRSLPARRLAALRHCLAALGLPPAGLHRAHHYLHLLDTAPQVSHTPPRMMSAGVVWRSLPARRLAALRHCLAALGLPPAGLHRAHHYLHLLDTAPQVSHTPPRMMSAGVVWRSLPARRLAALRHCLAALGLPPAGLHRAHHYLHLLDTAPQVSHTPPRMMSAGVVWRSLPARRLAALRHCLAALGLPPAGLHRAHHYLHLLDTAPQVSHTPPRMMSAGVVWRSLPARRLAALRHCLAALGLPPAGLHRAHHYLHLLDTAPQVSHTPPRMMSAGVVWRSLPARRLAALRHCLAALGLPPAGLHRAHHYLHLLDTAPQVSHTPPRMMSAGVVWRSLPARRLAALRHCLAALGLPPAGLHRAHHYLHLLDTAPQVSHTPPRMMSAGVVWRSLPARRLAALRHCLAALGLPPAGLHRAHHYLHLLDTAPQVSHTPPRMMSAGVVWRSLPARRLAALRHCLAALGLPPAGLHRAHHYLHLLDTAPQVSHTPPRMMSAGVVWRSLPARRLAALRHCLAALGLPPAGLHRAHHYLHLLDTAPQVSHTPPRMMSAGVVWRSLPARRLAALRHCLAALGLPPAGLHRAHHYLHLLDTAPQVSHTPPRMMSAGVVWRSLPARRLAALRHCLAALGLPPAGLHRAHHYLHLLDTAPQVSHTPPRMMSAGVVWRSLPARRLAALRHCLAALGLPPAGLHRAHHYLHLLDTAPQVSHTPPRMMSAGVVWRSLPARRLAALRHCLAALGLPPAGLHRAHHYLHLLDTAPQVSHTPPRMMSAGVVWRSLPARRLAALRHCLAALGLPPAGLHRAHHYLHLLDTAPQVSHTPPRMMSAGVVWRSLPARRLAALRHCLAALGLPPAGLHRAHHYLHLLDTAPQVSHTPPRMMSAGVVWRSLPARRLAALRHCLAALGLPPAGLHRAHHYLHLLDTAPQVSHTPPRMMSAGVVWRSLPARRLAALRHCLAALGLPPAGLHRAHHYLHLLDTAPQVSHTPPRMMSAYKGECN
ncbi:hypothetical protein O0L34_g14286 [Tuta absoluta]|nr:hypothetical protein O0L34_g14286 [Tuta absoluta]